MPEATSVLLGIEDEFDVVDVGRIGPGQVKIIIEMRVRGGAVPGVRGDHRPGEGPAVAADQGPAGQRPADGAVVAETPAFRVREVLCPRRSFTQSSRAIRPRARLTERLRDKLAHAIAAGNRAVSEVADEFEVSWPTAHKALVAAAARWLPEPAPTSRLGIDETRFRSVRWMLDGIIWKRSDPWLTSFVDCSADGPGSLLGLAPGRTGGCVKDWLGEQTPAFRAAIELVVIDPSAPYASGIRAALPGVRIAVDKWHLVALANQMVTEVRQRVTRDQLGRRGTTRDPVWVNRRLLLTGADHLTTKQWARLNATLHAGDPTNEIGAAWAVKERLRMLLAEHEPSQDPVAAGRLLRRRDRGEHARDHPARQHHPDLVARRSSWPSPSRSATPAPKGSTGSSNRPNASAAATATWTTTSAVSSATSRSPDRRDQQHERDPAKDRRADSERVVVEVSEAVGAQSAGLFDDQIDGFGAAVGDP